MCDSQTAIQGVGADMNESSSPIVSATPKAKDFLREDPANQTPSGEVRHPNPR